MPEILLLLLSAMLAGADDCVEIERRGQEQLVFPRRFLPCKHGLPSRDTLNDGLAALDPDLFKACSARWGGGLCEVELGPRTGP